MREPWRTKVAKSTHAKITAAPTLWHFALKLAHFRHLVTTLMKKPMLPVGVASTINMAPLNAGTAGRAKFDL